MTESFQPTLLLSMPQLQDPNFARSVVLLCDYMPDGAFGLVLNRPTDLPASTMVKLEPAIADGNSLPLCIGGPVEPDRGWILLADPPDEPEYPDGLRRVVPVDVADPAAARAVDVAAAAGARPRRLRRLGTGQLDTELAQSAWLIGKIELDLVFDTEPERMWETAIRRLGADPSSLQTSHGVH